MTSPPGRTHARPGLSIDSLCSHFSWMRDIQEKFGIEIPFPIIEDISMKMAGACGMVHPGTADTHAVRATFLSTRTL